MSDEELKHLQSQAVERIAEVTRKNEHVLGLFQWGSMAVDANDAFSDVDLICFMDTEEKTGRLELFETVSNLHPLLSRLYLYDKFALYLFDNGIRLDLDFYRPSEVKQIDRTKAKVLHDPKGFIAEHLADHPVEKSPRPTWNDNEGDLAEWFIWMFRQVYAWGRRAEQGSYKAFDKLLGAQNSLTEIRNKLLDIRRYLMDERDYIQRTDPELAARLARTFPDFTPAAVLSANRLLLEEFEVLVPSYYAQIGKTYPADKVGKLKRMLVAMDAIE